MVGINIYRSFDSEFGPFQRVTDIPVGSTFWRDRTDVELIEDELVTPDKWVFFGRPASESLIPQYIFRTVYEPIVKSGSQGVWANSAEDAVVYIDGKLARVYSVRGQAGEVQIDPREFANVALQNFDPSVVPSSPQSTVLVTYRRLKTLLKTDLAQRVFYRICSVALPSGCDLSCVQPNDFVETPLEHGVATSNFEIEKLDYIWRESIRRNRWILEQGGERVRVFLKKHVGITCVCIPDGIHKQPQADCLKCFGSGILGGYEGPYETIMAPDDAERRIAQKDIGRTVEHTYEVFTGPVPLLSQRDFLVKLNGERYSIGSVRMPTNRGMVLQQHFNIGHLDEQDIRYKVPMDDPVKYAAVQFAPRPPEEGGPTPITEKENIPDERELRGRTLTWENITYAILLFAFPWHETLQMLGRFSDSIF
jgi:hypothetical protein